MPCPDCNGTGKVKFARCHCAKPSRTCDWFTVNEYGYFRTSCGESTHSKDGEFCPFCGKSIGTITLDTRGGECQ